MSSHRRRLAQDQASIRASPPPDYFFTNDSLDDLTGLSIYLVGPTETPYESGVFHITLRIPTTYPQEPPKANFGTKIFHPNVDDRTGDVCVDTLKRDWNPKLTLHDVFVTIRCLLVYPNPTSSLNEAAGKLLLDDYDGFARHARLMTEVHAIVPDHLKELVEETRKRDTVDDEPVPQKKLVANPGSTNTATKPASSPRHKRPVVRKIKRAASPTKAPIAGPGSESDSEGGDSGKENVVARPRPASPSSVKRSREESVAPHEENEKGGAARDAPEESGRKSPKLKEGTNSTSVGRTRKDVLSVKPKTITTTSSKKAITTSGKSSQKKSAPKVGLKRF